jgi:RNA polymerase II subunit A-like phosphatase
VQINRAQATALDTESTNRLLEHRKLSLIVDLDQTILHATVDPTVGEWKNDPQNPNYGALSKVGMFRLRTDGSAIKEEIDVEKAKSQQEDEGCWYYVKQRPGLENFLADLSTRYEMHVYTMGTRSYAESVCRLVDPKGTIFGARILSRDENGSLIQKSLKKLFPVDTSMVVIIDDRADVWQWSPHLVKVVPYDFFVGIGDINASFLPAVSSITAPAKEEVSAVNVAPESGTEESEAKKELSDDGDAAADEAEEKTAAAAAAAVAESSQRTVVSEQLGSRPLAKMQEALDVKNEESLTKRANKDQAVLHDSDTELDRLRSILDQIHQQWYRRWDETVATTDKPDTTSIIASMKRKVLRDCVIVFSSVFPMNMPPEVSDLWQLASEYGAICRTEIDDSVTHLVAGKADTHKVFLARQKKKIAIIWPDWLRTSCAAWHRQGEANYALPERSFQALSSSDAGQISSESDQLLTSFESNLPDGDEEDDDEDEEQGFGELDWDEANDEVDAVLNGLTDDEDTGDEGYTTDGSIKRKRNRSSGSSSIADEVTQVESTEDGEGQQTNLSPLSKRRKMAEMRVGQSKLKHAVPVTIPSKSHSRTHSEAGGDTDDDFLRSLEDELELQLGGSGEDDGQQQHEEGSASDDE